MLMFSNSSGILSFLDLRPDKEELSMLSLMMSTLCVLLLLVSEVHGVQAASSRFRYKSGFFVQGERSLPVPASNPPRMGLVEGKQWQDVHSELETKRDGVTLMKLVVFLRHGEGTHNVAIEKYGSDAWNAYYCKLPEYLDAPLTANGVNQAEEASERLNAEINNGLRLEHVLISPTPLELPREILGVETCNKHRSISEKRRQYPNLDFSSFEADEDPLWTPGHRETNAEIETRASTFLTRIFNMSAQTVGVVSHSVFGAALLRVIGHREYSLGTAELLPLLVEEYSTT
ncbi:putative phosphoglycerate mutase [Phytophthora citrophthora]|uniref:Phosphoglycerate mutase n=1 Tax=Phytophthora citrophthora TaxID=4793 RepID=A0AAD9H2J9_9STRA|nr:putative phosphoglycerate mutase [Phytophthora citrophthora]